MSTSTLTIGKLARDSGVGIDTVRFYERAGLLPPARRTPSGYRLYGAADRDRLQFIRRAKALGFTLDEVRELLKLSEGRGGRAGVKALAERRLADIEARIRELSALRDTLAHYVHRCSGHGSVEGCPIVEALVASPTLENPQWNTPTTARTPAARARRKN